MKKWTLGMLGTLPLLAGFNEHYWMDLDDKGVVKLDDGSKWSIVSDHLDKFKEWKGIPLRFEAKESWLAPGVFCYFIHPDAKEKVQVLLISAPVAYEPFAHWLVLLEADNKYLRLDNAATFSLYENDREYFSQWQVEDFVITGDYKSLLSPCRHILFNYRTKEFIFGELH